MMGPGTPPHPIGIWDDGAQSHGIFLKMRFRAKRVDIGCIEHFFHVYDKGDVIAHLWSGLVAETARVVS